MIEEWRDVVGWEKFYQVSCRGNLRSKYRTIVRSDGSTQTWTSRPLKTFANSSGYLIARLSDSSNGRRKMARVHRLVAEAFIPNPENKPEVNHIDSDRANPALENLEWVTASENRKHGVLQGNVMPPQFIGSEKPNSKLTEQIVADARRRHASGESLRGLARKYGVDKRTIGDAIKGITWAHVPTPPLTKGGEGDG